MHALCALPLTHSKSNTRKNSMPSYQVCKVAKPKSSKASVANSMSNSKSQVSHAPVLMNYYKKRKEKKITPCGAWIKGCVITSVSALRHSVSLAHS